MLHFFDDGPRLGDRLSFVSSVELQSGKIDVVVETFDHRALSDGFLLRFVFALLKFLQDLLVFAKVLIEVRLE